METYYCFKFKDNKKLFMIIKKIFYFKIKNNCLIIDDFILLKNVPRFFNIFLKIVKLDEENITSTIELFEKNNKKLGYKVHTNYDLFGGCNKLELKDAFGNLIISLSLDFGIIKYDYVHKELALYLIYKCFKKDNF